MKVKYVFATLILISIMGCKKKISNIDYTANYSCNAATPGYDKDIAPILNNSCAFNGCHNQTSHKAFVTLSDFENARSQFLNNKKVLISVHHDPGASPMPKGSKRLTEEQIRQLVCWTKNNCPR